MIKLEFYETRPPHSRHIFIKQIENILNCSEFLSSSKVILNKITNSSFFSILWTPFKCHKNIGLNTSFLVYYQFNLGTQYINEKMKQPLFTEIPIIGILPIKFENKLFLSKINKSIIYI
jgi:hypothetical protein